MHRRVALGRQSRVVRYPEALRALTGQLLCQDCAGQQLSNVMEMGEERVRGSHGRHGLTGLAFIGGRIYDILCILPGSEPSCEELVCVGEPYIPGVYQK